MKTNMLKDKYGYYMNHNTLLPLLGVNPGCHFPKEGFTKMIDGVTFFCTPEHDYRPSNGSGKSSRHRVYYECNCGRWIPYGRASQHNKAKVHQS